MTESFVRDRPMMKKSKLPQRWQRFQHAQILIANRTTGGVQHFQLRHTRQMREARARDAARTAEPQVRQKIEPGGACEGLVRHLAAGAQASDSMSPHQVENLAPTRVVQRQARFDPVGRAVKPEVRWRAGQPVRQHGRRLPVRTRNEAGPIVKTQVRCHAGACVFDRRWSARLFEQACGQRFKPRDPRRLNMPLEVRPRRKTLLVGQLALRLAERPFRPRPVQFLGLFPKLLERGPSRQMFHDRSPSTKPGPRRSGRRKIVRKRLKLFRWARPSPADWVRPARCLNANIDG